MIEVSERLHGPNATETADTLAVMDDTTNNGFTMPGYDSSTYGDRFADIYDTWYHDVSDVNATVSTICDLCPVGGSPTPRLLELGVGTGRLALPLAHAGFEVDGIDASAAMLTQLCVNDPDGIVRQHLGDMITSSPPGPFEVILIAFNTIFNLPGPSQQAALFEAMAQRLGPNGRFIIEASVPDVGPSTGTTPRSESQGTFSATSEVRVRSMTVDQVVLSVSRHDPSTGRAEGQFIEISETGGVRLRPWSIRSVSLDELDHMATAAGMVLEQRWEDFSRRDFTEHSDRHVSIYRLS
jgi:SAM-dependent methyltransferase